MPRFPIGRFVEGRVLAAGWWAPEAGRTYRLAEDSRGNLIVGASGGVLFVWPNAPYQDAALQAWRYYDARARARAEQGQTP